MKKKKKAPSLPVTKINELRKLKQRLDVKIAEAKDKYGVSNGYINGIFKEPM